MGSRVFVHYSLERRSEGNLSSFNSNCVRPTLSQFNPVSVCSCMRCFIFILLSHLRLSWQD
jgi:hypothetical protein